MRHNVLNAPYLGAGSDNAKVRVPAEVIARLRDQRFAQQLTVRELAKAISVIRDDEAEERRNAHGHTQDFSGLRVSYETLRKLPLGLQQEPRAVTVALPTAALIYCWLHEEPHFETPFLREYYRVKWLPLYHAQLREKD